MMFVDFQQEDRPVVRCIFVAGPVPEANSSYWSEIAPLPGRPYRQPGQGRRSGQGRGCAQCARTRHGVGERDP